MATKIGEIKQQTLTVGNIPFDRDIDVATNELFLRATINRNTEKLLSNDLYLYDFILKFKESGDYTINPWKARNTYHLGDVVIYTEYDADHEKILNLYLLQCIVDSNDEEPKKVLDDKYIANFSNSGWENLNPFFSLFYSEDPESNLTNYLRDILSNRFELSHELDLQYHRFGNLSAHAISSVVLRKDITNISDQRTCGYWPYETIELSTDAYSGSMRKWGMGVVEYDLTCKLVGSQQITKIADSGAIETHDFLAANSFTPLSSELNDNYFMNAGAYSIFSRTGSSEIIEANGVYQTNLLSTMNVYHGKIKFPQSFADVNYMVFITELAKDISNPSSPNVVTFVDRTKESIEMVYAVPNYNGLPIEDIALNSNAFGCQIIGRWK